MNKISKRWAIWKCVNLKIWKWNSKGLIC
jgi:hypothetical protein